MINDPFGQFSSVFASEFAKQAGTAAITAWQEALKSSFSPTGANNESPDIGDVVKKWFATGAAPADFFQQFVETFPGPATSTLGAGGNYLQFAEYIQKYLDMFSAGVEPSNIAEQMSSTFKQSLDQLSSISSSPWMNLFDQIFQGMGSPDLHKSMTDMFGQAMSQSGFSPNAFFSAIGNLSDENFSKLNSPAAVGPAREWQIAMQEVSAAAGRYRHAQARMQQHTAATFDGASKQFWQELGQGEQELSSIREIYDFWVNCAEEAYAGIVMTDEYSRDFGESINSQANLKLKFTALLSRFFEMLNIPNRREVDGVIQNLSNIEMRLEDIEQQAALNSNDIALTSAAAINELKKEVKALRAELASSSDAVASIQTKPAKKRKTKKQASKTSKDKTTDLKVDKRNTRKKVAKNKSNDSKVAEFEIAKITNAN